MRKASAILALLLGVSPSLAQVGTIPDSKNQIVKLTDKGIDPPILRMEGEDQSVFFLNDSTDSLVTLSVYYGGKKSHCASSNLEMHDDGTVRSKRPFGPRDFASVCLPDKGAYELRVFGLKPNPEGLTSKIIVE